MRTCRGEGRAERGKGEREREGDNAKHTVVTSCSSSPPTAVLKAMVSPPHS